MELDAECRKELDEIAPVPGVWTLVSFLLGDKPIETVIQTEATEDISGVASCPSEVKRPKSTVSAGFHPGDDMSLAANVSTL